MTAPISGFAARAASAHAVPSTAAAVAIANVMRLVQTRVIRSYPSVLPARPDRPIASRFGEKLKQMIYLPVR